MLGHTILVNLAFLVSAASPSGPPFLTFKPHCLVSTHEIRVSIQQPQGFHAAGPIDHTPTFSGHPYAVTLAAYLGDAAFLMVHAERVLDRSGASDYSKLENYRLGKQDFRTKVQCAALTTEDVAGEHDLTFLATNGFPPTAAMYLRQLVLTTGDHNAEVVITYGERVASCKDSVTTPAFRDGFDAHLRRVVNVVPAP